MPLEVDIWRIFCRQQDLQRSVPLVAKVLSRRLALVSLAVRRFDGIRGRLEALAEASVSSRGHGPEPFHPTNIELPAPELLKYQAWCRLGRVEFDPPDGDPLRFGEPRQSDRTVVVCPLFDPDHDLAGALTLVVVAPVEELTLSVVSGLVEPFTLALGNHLRFQELTRLREALEADKQALLTRLDRQDITETIVGENRGLSEVMQSISQVAPTDAPVLILGETGSGKEVVARAIHQRSKRAAGPMVRVNCGAISPGLIDSELFGHEKGSFSGAVAQRRGWFERADGGTLFLDEVGELPLDAQVRLLRVLQDGVVERLGGHRAIHVDVRIVAATHRDLEQMVTQGGFRRDLWYRLGVFIVPLPPLRERKSDVAALASHFAAKAGKRLGGLAIVPSARDLELLLSYDWPGNVRELAAVIERAAILGDGRILDLARALGVTGSGAVRPAIARVAPTPTHESGGISTLNEAARKHIEDALELTHGRIEGLGGAAELLKVNPHTLRSRMRKLAIDWSQFRR